MFPAYITINDGASIITEATTIFNGDTERFVNLLSTRKEISKAINTFINNRREVMAITPEQRAEYMEAEEKIIDVDQERMIRVLNINAWVRSAQGLFDVYNDYDINMLNGVAACVEKSRLIINANPFISTVNNETRRKSVVMSKDKIVPPRNDIEKRVNASKIVTNLTNP